MKKKPSNEEVINAFEVLPKEVKNTLQELFKQAPDDPEEFQRLVMVGDCPFCGSSKTKDCDEAKLGDITVGICLDCCRMWCLDCGYLFPNGQTICDHWAICTDCGFSDEEGQGCEISPVECSIIKEKLGTSE